MAYKRNGIVASSIVIVVDDKCCCFAGNFHKLRADT